MNETQESCSLPQGGKSKNESPLIVVGGGAAGLMAAGQAALAGAEVLVLEKNAECGGGVMSMKA